MYRGRVYNKEEKPIVGVRVSDGRNICVTDEHGEYYLPGWEKARVISVGVLTTAHNDWYTMIEENREKYDFHIDPYESYGAVSFLHISDTEIFINGLTHENWLDFVLNCAKNEKTDFIIHTGDICRKKGLDEHYKLLNSKTAKIPVRYTLGNHDYVAEGYGEYTFERLYGPAWYSFDLGNVHYVILPITSGEASSGYSKTDRAAWLKEDLKHMKPEQKLAVFSHTHGDISEEMFTVSGDGFTLDLREHRLLFWAFGHFHVNYLNECNGVFSICTARPDCGGIDGTPAACRTVRINEAGELTSHMIYNEEKHGGCEVKRVNIGERICFTHPICDSEGVFLASFDDGYPKSCAIYKLNFAGEVLWRFPTLGSVKWNMAQGDGRLYAIDTVGRVYCIDSRSGKEIFQTDLDPCNIRFFSGGVALYEDRLYTTSCHKMYVLSAKDGHLISSLDTKNIAVAGTVLPYVYENKIIWGKHWQGLLTFDKDTLDEMWLSDVVKDSVARSVVYDGSIIAPTRYRIARLSLSGEVICQSSDYNECTFDSYSEPLIHDGILYVATTDMGVAAFDAKTLKEIHRFECGGSMLGVCPYTTRGQMTVCGSPLIIAGKLIFAAADGCVYFYNINNYTLARKICIGHPLISGVCVTPTGLAVADFDGGISFIDL